MKFMTQLPFDYLAIEAPFDLRYYFQSITLGNVSGFPDRQQEHEGSQRSDGDGVNLARQERFLNADLYHRLMIIGMVSSTVCSSVTGRDMSRKGHQHSAYATSCRTCA